MAEHARGIRACRPVPFPAAQPLWRIGSSAIGPVSTQVLVDAPRQRVFDLLVDIANRPAFLDHFTDHYNLLQVRSDGVGAGARFRVDVPLRTLWMESVIERADRPHRIDEAGRTGRIGRIGVRTVFELVEVGEGMTEVTVTFWTAPEHWWDRVREAVALGEERWWRRQWRRGLERLREIAESERPLTRRLRVAGGNPSLTGVP